ncbi:hypothetical protein [Marinigracilibium pacificum]|uniref:DUF2116 family Zn-ribbon domain-containing protein n=1 Tax=Marinigracilibium pacificum TaxID=2729599 RepID=A0A848J259_9BACT|nr:hypothetical protein [Marinigracilibium pacificum]NMM48399.1 hypothetical protein [Marinigracilibium pacificum]
MESRACKLCGDTIRPGSRADKIFCTDQCRSSYNNKVSSKDNNLIRRINSRLQKNRRILSKLNPSGKTKITRESLIAYGFDFSYITSIYRAKNGNTYVFVYDQGYIDIGDNNLILVKNQRIVENISIY